MYARVTTYKLDPARLDEMTAKLDSIKGAIAEISGVVSTYSAWRADGDGVTFAVYESQAAAEAASGQVQAIWAGMAEYLTAPPNAEAYDSVEHLAG